jgi:hypothetical protein
MATMRAFGYTKGENESEEPIELREVSMLCSIDDLRRLQAFLEKVITERSADNSLDKGPWHDHFRDRDERWTDDEADFMICVE